MSEEQAAQPQSGKTDEPPSTGSWFRRLGQRLAGGPRNRDELMEVLEEAVDQELVDNDAVSMIQGVRETAELQVRDIMIPRGQITAIEKDWSLDRILPVVVDSGHSRFPVIGESKDQVIGLLLAKDLLRFSMPGNGENFELTKFLRPAVFVPESKRVNVLLKDFRGSRNHMALVVDEYGGVSGLVTIEDVLELIVGEIDDEYDEIEGAAILKQEDNRYLVNGLTPIEDFNAHFGCEFSDEEFDTVGGLVIHRFGHMPRRGETVSLERFKFTVQRADSRRVHLLQVLLNDSA